MISRSRSSPKLITPMANNKKTDDDNETTVVPSTYSISNMPRLWKIFLGCLTFGLLIYLFDLNGLRTSDRHRTVRSTTKSREMTIVMNTFKRHDMMLDAIDYYSNCKIVKYIHVIWSEKEKVPQRISSRFKNSDIPQVIFNIQDIDSLNNRFKPLDSFPHTEAIFSVDDDMRVPCDELDLAYEVWRGSPKSLIGFMPRIHLRNRVTGLLEYRCWWKVWWEGAYSIILTKAALLHHDYFKAYFNLLPKTIFELVDKKRNCEDIVMQFLIANMTNLPPIYVKGHLEDLGALNGISTSQNVVKAGHMKQRDACLNELVELFGHNPLVKSHLIIDSANNGWTNSPSTWFEYLSSDLWKW